MSTTEIVFHFLREVERQIPIPEGAGHHALTFALYGSDESGWEEKLAFHVRYGDIVQTFFLDEGDLEQPEKAIAEMIPVLLKGADQTN